MCNKARALFAKYCSEPLPKDPYAKMRWEMAGAHAYLTDALHNIYLWSDKISPSEEQDFAFFCYCAIQNIEHHHHLEETHVFPSMEPEYKTDVLNEHAAFAKGLHDLESYLLAVMEHIKNEADGPSVVVFAVFHFPPYSQSPQLPWILQKVLVPYVLYWKHRKSWRWLPDYSKQPFGPLVQI
ncbi:hypothetical protein FRC15_011790 [Serendipita sp. 397]|nr:hypothetical protein FRC15_011790 [Serendipita sp. 397]